MASRSVRSWGRRCLCRKRKGRRPGWSATPAPRGPPAQRLCPVAGHPQTPGRLQQPRAWTQRPLRCGGRLCRQSTLTRPTNERQALVLLAPPSRPRGLLGLLRLAQLFLQTSSACLCPVPDACSSKLGPPATVCSRSLSRCGQAQRDAQALVNWMCNAKITGKDFGVESLVGLRQVCHQTCSVQ